ncbi:MAG: ATP-binding protein [Longimicrobiales bacterium]
MRPIPSIGQSSLRRLPKEQYASWVRIGTYMAILGYAAFYVATLLLGEPGSVVWFSEGAVVAAGFVSLWLQRKDRARAAGALVLTIIWFELHYSIYSFGYLWSSPVLIFPVMVVCTGLLTTTRVAFLVASLTTVAAPAAALLGRALHGTEGNGLSVVEDLSILATLVPAMFVALGLVTLALHALHDALESAIDAGARVRQVVDDAPDGILTVDDGVVVALNPAAARILGGVVEELLGAPLGEVLEPRDDDGRNGVRLLLEQRNLTPVTLILRDGDMVVEATSDASEGPAGHERIQVVLRDVTARHRAESRAGQLGRILQEALGEVYVLSPEGDGRLLMASRGARENLGYALEDLSDLHPSDINPSFTAARLREASRRAAAPLPVRGIHRRRDGSVYPVETQLQDTVLDGRTVLVAFVLDISERVRAEEDQRKLQRQLEHAQRMEAVGQLAGGVAHDFNNLLMVVGGCADILSETDDEMVGTLAREILKAQERGARLTRQLLAFARKEVVQPKALELSTVLPETRPLLERLLGEQFELVIDVRDDPWIVGDQGQLEQVLLNLAANARDAMPDGGRVTLRAWAPEGSDEAPAVLSLSDQGVGMDPDTVTRAFDPFFTSKPRGQGTGLGLSTVHGIVTQNGGRVELESERTRGTTVTLHWPRAPKEWTEQVAHQAEPDLDQPGQGRILVVEDDDSARGLVALILERGGYEVISAADADEGTDALEAHDWAFDLLLTDVIMPGRSGVELAEDVRAVRPELPILFMSGYLEDRIDAIPGVDATRDLILKPFRAKELLARVAEVLRPRTVAG